MGFHRAFSGDHFLGTPGVYCSKVSSSLMFSGAWYGLVQDACRECEVYMYIGVQCYQDEISYRSRNK